MAGSVARNYGQYDPAAMPPETGEICRLKTFLPAGGFFLPLRGVVSQESDWPVFREIGETIRTKSGLTSATFASRFLRISESAEGWNNRDEGPTGRTKIPQSGLSAGQVVRRSGGPGDEVSWPANGDGESRRTPVPGSGQSFVPLLAKPKQPDELAWPANADGESRRTQVAGLGRTAAQVVRPARVLEADILPPDQGETSRSRPMPTGAIYAPLARRNPQFNTEAVQSLFDVPQTQRMGLAGTGKTAAPLVRRGVVCESVSIVPGLEMDAGETTRKGGPQLSNEGQVVPGPYTVDALQLWQAGAVVGQTTTEG